MQSASLLLLKPSVRSDFEYCNQFASCFAYQYHGVIYLVTSQCRPPGTTKTKKFDVKMRHS